MLRLVFLRDLIQSFFVEHGLKARVYTEKIQVTRGIFHGIPRESVAQVVPSASYAPAWLLLIIVTVQTEGLDPA